MSRIIKQDLGLGSFKQQTGHRLTVAIKVNRKTFNKQKDRVYARSSKEARKLVPRIERGYYLP